VATSIYAYRLNFVNPRTDDAAVRANVVGIAPQVNGPIVDLRVTEVMYLYAADKWNALPGATIEARTRR